MSSESPLANRDFLGLHVGNEEWAPTIGARDAAVSAAVARLGRTDRTGFLDNLQFNDNAFTFLGSTERFLRDTLSIAGRFRAGPHRVSSR